MEAATDCTKEKSAAQRKRKIAKVTFSDSERSEACAAKRVISRTTDGKFQKDPGTPESKQLSRVVSVVREWFYQSGAAKGSWYSALKILWMSGKEKQFEGLPVPSYDSAYNWIFRSQSECCGLASRGGSAAKVNRCTVAGLSMGLW